MNKYIIHDRISGGGYANVYRCISPSGAKYACKVLCKTQNPPERVHHEVDILKTLSTSTYVPRFIDFYDSDQAYYIVQELCNGDPLGHHKHDEYQVILIVRELLRAVYDIHAKNIVHRDLKHNNVLYDFKTNDLKVIDFGVSLFGEGEVKSPVGTISYMSPEHLNHMCYFSTDIWSIGVIVYTLLSGSYPFRDMSKSTSESQAGIFKSIFNDEPSFKGRKWDAVSDQAKDFCRLCLQKNKNRPTTLDLLGHPWL